MAKYCLLVRSTTHNNNRQHRQFIDRGLKSFYVDLGIKYIIALVEHPQTNRQAEAANKIILNELKKHLSKAKG